jgi:hypothetical protein
MAFFFGPSFVVGTYGSYGEGFAFGDVGLVVTGCECQGDEMEVSVECAGKRGRIMLPSSCRAAIVDTMRKNEPLKLTIPEPKDGSSLEIGKLRKLVAEKDEQLDSLRAECRRLGGEK